MRSLHRRDVRVAGLVVASLLIGAAPAVAAGQAKVRTVVSGLDNPRHLTMGPGGRLYVAEAGHGGSACVPAGEEGPACVGFTSRISRVDVARRKVHHVVSGLLSIADQDGSGATGVDGISALPDGTVFGIITGSAAGLPPGLPSAILPKVKAMAGRLIEVRPNGKLTIGAAVGDAGYRWTARHKSKAPRDFPDANPYGVLALPNVRWVVDAGANTIDRVSPKGKVAIAQFIPNPPVGDAVPTCIDRGPDGALYVGQLTAAGNEPGSAAVWRYAPGARKPLTKWATGLTAVTGCAWVNGRFYATEFSTKGLEHAAPGTGALVRVRAHSRRPVVVASKLSFPNGVTGAGRTLYVSNWSVAPAGGAAGAPTGQVLRVVLPRQRRVQPQFTG